MKPIILSVLSCLFLFCTASTPGAEADGALASESAWPGHVSYTIGYKYLSLGDSGPASSHQFEFAGVDVDFRRTNWPVSIAAELLAAAGGGFISTEANLGLRKILEASPRFEPFVGAGVTVASVSDVFVPTAQEWEATLKPGSTRSSPGIGMLVSARNTPTRKGILQMKTSRVIKPLPVSIWAAHMPWR